MTHPVRHLIEAFRRTLAPFQADEAHAGRFRARQIQAVLRLTPLTMFANALNASIVTATFLGQINPILLMGWALCILYASGVGIEAWLKWRHGKAPESVSPRALSQAAKHAALLGLLWSLVPMFFLPAASLEQQLMLASITVGMLCAGGFALATVPQAALTYVTVLGLGTFIGLLRLDHPLSVELALLLAIYTLIVLGSVLSNARTFGARLVAEADGERQRQLIGLLLRDFEESASDWLWEIDRHGRLTHVSRRMASVFGRDEAALLHQPLLELIANTLDRATTDERQALEGLRRCFAGHEPFRDVLAPVILGGETRWWSLTAKPLLDDAGELAGWRGVGTDVTASLAAQREVTRLAHFDGLTGLANRHRFQEVLAGIEDGSPEHPGQALLLCLDLDNFKTVNDSLGHSFGDGLLRVVAQRLLGRTRRSDLVARLGGDEFAIVREGPVTPEDAEDLAERLIQILSDPCEIDGIRVRVGASIGIAIAPKDGQSGDQLLKNADIALYAAKYEGKGRFRFFDYEMDTRARRRLFLEHELRGALNRGEFHLVFQPQFATDTRAITGCEALLRWVHPRLGPISTQECIAVAEESGQVEAIGNWVIDSAIDTAVHWPESINVSINLSLAQFMDPTLCDRILNKLYTAGLPPHRLELELTESVFLSDQKMAEQQLLTLKGAGIRIALDDFGTGYSSLAYLRNYPFDRLKIDRAFVSEIPHVPEAAAIVRAVIAMANSLHMDTCAEGVENEAQLAHLQQEACHTVQGFLLARPMTAEALKGFLDGHRIASPAPPRRAGTVTPIEAHRQRL
ncbi:EAL domain-containing protein [Nitrogeniibacter mangrovi]|uniref:EAL domain-containing protein n=1 Tax=Nitrogeniibacter mangrovi TaxID=2016596 RepID=A0A6C1B9D3_9RHOO|nr:EAL domain-containing protein [Nitrogeniibacter mangrovi]QID18950.1 EAL domain-containing protein [Nitrogeniibacter mangrovi]